MVGDEYSTQTATRGTRIKHGDQITPPHNGTPVKESILEFQGKYRFLSNFWPSPILGKNSLTYPTVEHAFQASKFPDGSEEHEKIRTATTPGIAKKLGRTLGLPRENWNDIRVELMGRLLRLKFSRGSPLATKLLETEYAELVEGNSWGDKFWGVCKGEGENMLGKLLMTIREELRNVCK